MTPKELFADLVAATTVWQTQTGAESAAQAKARIFGYGTDDALVFPAMYVSSEAYRLEKYASEAFDASGRFKVAVDYARPTAATRRAEEAIIEARAIALIEAIADQSRLTGVLTFRQIELASAPELNLEGTDEAFWTINIVVEWPGSRA
jgi:hypothetical protein